MHIVAIHGWKEETAEFVQALAGALGITAFEARQRLIGGGPSVVASFADPAQARALAARLHQAGIATLVVDADEVRGRAGRLIVRRFEMGERALRVEGGEEERWEVPYGEVDLLLPGTNIVGETETKTVTERTFSLGKTLLSGGIPMTKKVERQEAVTTETREKFLYLYAGDRPQIVFRQSGMVYDGLGATMQMSRELNFNYLVNELRRLCPAARYDDRFLSRAGQVRVLGPAQNPETHLDLAAEVLAQSLLSGRRG
jgi:hypothetical protein